MTQIQEICNDIYWIGAFDPNMRIFDIDKVSKFGTTYNAYLVKTDVGGVLIETVKEKFFDSYIDHVRSVIGDISRIKYLIMNHTEPDHSGSIHKLLNYIPSVTIIASKTAISYLRDIVNRDFQYRSSEQLETLRLGKRTFDFIHCPFLHWPDSMWTYLKAEKLIFTCDTFGCHYCPKDSILISKMPKDVEDNYQSALKYYFTEIFTPFKNYVLKGISKIENYDLKYVCNGHGPVLDSRVWEIINAYKRMAQSAQKRPKKLVVIPYCSAYGYTGSLADDIKKGIKDVDPDIEVKQYRIDIQNYAMLKPQILADMEIADGIALGTPTVNGDALPFLWDLALSINPVKHANKILTAFGSYGWAGEGVDNLITRFRRLRCKVIEGYKIRLRPSTKEHTEAVNFGRTIGKSVKTGEIPLVKPRVKGAATWEELNPSGKVVLWRCVVCGEIVAGVAPPLACPACGVEQECFELYEEEVITFFAGDKAETFVIIGSGAAAVSAAEAIRARSNRATIKMVSNEDKIPYYRTVVTNLILKDIPFEKFNVHENKWYDDKRIEVILNTTIIKIDPKNRKVLTDSNTEICYDKLIIATGANPVRPPLRGGNASNVVLVRTDGDAIRVRELAKQSKRAVIIGGGVIGLEIADSVSQLGCHVELIEFLPRLMPRNLDEDSSNYLSQVIEQHGVKLHTSTAARYIKVEDGKAVGVNIGKTTLDCDFVVINVGIRANVDLAREAGIRCHTHIIVNEKMETSERDIYACGDCAEFGRECQELWQPALNQGKVAGANAVGDDKGFEWNREPLSVIAFGTEILSIGEVPPVDSRHQYSVVKEDNLSNGRFLKLYFKKNRLMYAVGVGFQAKANALIRGVQYGQSLQMVLSSIYK